MPYTTSEYQRRQDVVTGAQHAKSQYDDAIRQYGELDGIAKSGDNRAVAMLPGVHRRVEMLKGSLDTANAQLDSLYSETPLCSSPIPIPSGANGTVQAAPSWEAGPNLAEVHSQFDQDVRACPLDAPSPLDAPPDSGLYVPPGRSKRCEEQVRQRYQRQYPSLIFGQVE